MYISQYNQYKGYEEVEINKTLDIPEDTINSEGLDNQSTHQLQNAKCSGESEDEEKFIEETFIPEYQVDTESTIGYLHNQLENEEDDCEFDIIAYHYLKNGFMFFKVSYVGDTLGE